MRYRVRNLTTMALIALLVGCAATDQTEQTADGVTPSSNGTQPEITAQSYAYGQAPNFDPVETSGAPQAGGSKGAVASPDRVVYFDFDSADIRANSQSIVEANARYLTGHARAFTQLEGHTDERGSREYNIALGERRAQAVRQMMIALGVTSEQIRVMSYGEERPALDGSGEQAYALNRRVEIVY